MKIIFEKEYLQQLYTDGEARNKKILSITRICLFKAGD